MKNFMLKLERIIEMNINALTVTAAIIIAVTFFVARLYAPLDTWLTTHHVWSLLAIAFFMYVIRMLGIIGQRIKGDCLSAFPDQDTSNKEVEKLLQYYTPKRVDIFAYSSFTVTPVILALLKKKECKIRLLLADCSLFPEKECDFHKERQGSSLSNIRIHIKNNKDYADMLKIKIYNLRPSLRGIKLDDYFLSMGWYLHTIDKSDSKEILRGHCNPLIHLKKTSSENVHLFEMFDDYFTKIWSTAGVYDIWQAKVLDGEESEEFAVKV